MSEPNDLTLQLAERALGLVGRGEYDRERARRILERAAQWRSEHIRGFEITIAFHLKAAFKEMGVERILDIFEREDLAELEQRIRLVPHLASPDTPLYTLEELADLCAGFRAHLEANREGLLKNGSTTVRFPDSPWLEQRLGNLYYLVVPELDPKRRTDPLGRGRPDIWEDRAAAGARRHDRETRRLDLDGEEADLLESERAHVLDLKVRILRHAERALRAGRADEFWLDCCAELIKGLTRDRADFLLRQDRYYRDVDARAPHVGGSEPGVGASLTLPGGLSDLLDVAGHIECELRWRTLHDTKYELQSAAAQLGLSTWRDVLGESYLAMIESPWRPTMDEVLRRFAAREGDPRQFRFWSEYRERINRIIADDLEQNVVVRTTMPRRDRELYMAYVQGVGEFARIHLRITGTLPAVPLPDASTAGPARANSIRAKGRGWEVLFEGEVIPLSRLLGYTYVARLIAEQGKQLYAQELKRLAILPAIPELLSTAASDAELAELTTEDERDLGPVIGPEMLVVLAGEIQDLKARIKLKKSAGDSQGLSSVKSKLAEREKFLRQARNKKGKIRTLGDPLDQAARSVRGAINYALAKLKDSHPELAAHLDHSIKRHNPLSYRPESSPIRYP